MPDQEYGADPGTRPAVSGTEQRPELEPTVLKGPDSARSVDLLGYTYASLHYSSDGKPLSDWLVWFPRWREETRGRGQ
ncbi:hypothetical protein GCM10010211_58650 [Streptomyces albospinus]|uniref:Uncharacterized protein n=1 Tax=Streptomyces albospinus TaxID=285515 RepID=A0ABQ2VJ06_9ACTN|nr:hypothetical protein [Streptomyces albospinus]GGU84869.1 hypothetical protein GCM10010211_58650 [Streptomyces albospinus]